MQKPRIRFGVIGLNHGHINSQTSLVLKAGGELAWVYAKEPDLLADFQKRFPQAKVARSAKEVLEDKSLQLIVTAAIMNERAGLAIEAMRHGKDVMSDKPGMTTLAQLAEVRRVQQQTHRIFSIMFGERFENAATTKAGELVKAGAIGKVIQTVGLGPHRTNLPTRPDWFFVKEKYGGILCDIAAHQYDQFLYFTGSTKAEVVASQVGNFHHPQHPGLEDFGDVMMRGNGGMGYARIDWLTPDGLPTWGDTRLTVLGTEGYIEVRKNVDIAGRPGASHLFLVDKKGVQYVESKDTPLRYGELFVNDIVNRTETVMPQAHCFLAMELALQAEAKATRVVLEK
ncbi:MAG: Gfo/Idh/MocA family oxidoreductase [Acidobacteria bacterium]|nr:Gfo/Idh/MocA family oxidoreductase [Acidobacteriota bacterium]